MRVICENCGASYTVPDSKLTKAMNKATCKPCGHEMMIPKPGTESNESANAEEWEDEEQTRITESPLVRPPSPPPVAKSSAPQDDDSPHDPSGDLAWAALGSFLSLLGAFLLGLLSLPLGQFGEFLPDVVLWAGLAFAFGGSVLTLSILSTGRRGRTEANTILAVVAAFCIGIFMSSTLTTAKWGGLYVAENYEFSFDQSTVGASSTPIEAEAVEEDPVEDDLIEDEDGNEDGDEEAGDQDEPLEETADKEASLDAPGQPKVTAPSPRARVTTPAPRAPQPATQNTEEEELLMEDEPIIIPPRPAPAPEPTRNRRTRPAPAPAPNPTVPLETIDVILKNTNGVKACFVPLIKSGNIPPRIDVKFTLSGNGRASSISVVQSNYRGSSFEQCMQSSISAINFPASGGSGQNINFPFVLQ